MHGRLAIFPLRPDICRVDLRPVLHVNKNDAIFSVCATAQARSLMCARLLHNHSFFGGLCPKVKTESQ